MFDVGDRDLFYAYSPPSTRLRDASGISQKLSLILIFFCPLAQSLQVKILSLLLLIRLLFILNVLLILLLLLQRRK